MENETNPVDAVWESFWKDHLIDNDGHLKIDQMKKELHDYLWVLENYAKVLDYATGGKVTKPEAQYEAIRSAIDDHLTELFEKAETNVDGV